MFNILRPLRSAALLAVFALCAAQPAHSQSIKGANFLRLDHNYNSVPSTDPRRVGWNLEMSVDMPSMTGWAANYQTIYNTYGIKTLARLGYGIAPNSAERTALTAATFSCSSINTLLNSIDSHANVLPNHASIGAFILGNEPNLDWNIGGVAYGRVYRCARARWSSSVHAAKPLLAAGPGACHIYSCPTFYNEMFANMGSTVDGFAIHAYGQTGAAVDTDFRGQMSLINGSSNTAARNKQTFITEYNAGASLNSPLPVAPTQAYFNDVHTAVRNFNNSNNNQIKAVMYFVDSIDSWVRSGANCHPAVAPGTSGWWQTSLCYNGTWRQYWLDSQPAPTGTPLNASVALASVPNFMMPGQILRFVANTTNTGTTAWTGGGSSSMFRLGAGGSNSFFFSLFPQCGGFNVSTTNARIYTCSQVNSGGTYQYRVDARAPVSGSSGTFQVRMVQDGVAWFGTTASKTVALGQANCGTALTQCILNARTDILPFYQNSGWNTSCYNRDAIVSNWCSIDPNGCNALKTGTCASFNNTCRCSGGIHKGNVGIDTNATFCGYQVCGTDSKMYTCSTGNVWSNSGLTCN